MGTLFLLSVPPSLCMIPHMKRLSSLIPILFAVTSSGCGIADRPLLEVTGTQWPDGTAVILYDETGTVSSTRLYAGRTLISVPAGERFTLVARSRRMLTYRSPSFDRFTMSDEFTLPAPRPRRRAGAWQFGYQVSPAIPDSLERAVLSANMTKLTAVTIPVTTDSIGWRGELRESGVELLAELNTGFQGISRLREMIDSLAVKEYDGIVIPVEYPRTTDPSILAEGIAAAHAHGLTVCLAIPSDSLSTIGTLLESIAALPRPDRPDELRMEFAISHTHPFVSAEDILSSIQALIKFGFTADTITHEVTISAVKWQVHEGVLEPVDTPAGELDRLITTRGNTGAVRLGDGSMRMGNHGFLYGYIDTETITALILSLRAVSSIRVYGIHIKYDATGPFPTPDDLTRNYTAILNP